MAIYKCKNCGDPFNAREADRKRGWARYCSKSCKAMEQTRRTGRGSNGRTALPNGGYIERGQEYDRYGVEQPMPLSPGDMSGDALGQWT